MEAVNIADKFTGLQAGRLVNFVTKSGYIRPLLVLIAWQGTNLETTADPAGAKPKPNGRVNGIVFRDGSNDDAEFPKPESLALPAGSDGGNVIIPPPSVRLAEWATSVEYSEDHAPGTWHWPPKGESTIVFVTQEQLTGLLQIHDEQIEVKLKEWTEANNENITEACSALLVSDSFKTAVQQTMLDAQKAEDAVEGLPIEIQEINDLRDSLAKIQKVLEHHGLNGPAEVAPEQVPLPGGYIGSDMERQRLEEKAQRPPAGDSIVQTTGHAPQSGQVAIGGKSKGGNDGEANAAALANK